MKPGYRTTEHALAWGVVALGAVAVFRYTDAVARATAVAGPAVVSAAYSLARGRAKTPAPLDGATVREAVEGSLKNSLGELFRGRILK